MKMSLFYLFGVFTLLHLIDQLEAQTILQGAISFPEIEEDPYRKNKDNRQPVYLPSVCGLNELYYPGDQKDDWICDCRPAHIFHTPSDTCWPIYQQGPCAAGEHLILPKDTVLPICVKNPCNESYVKFNGQCQKLGSTGPCSYLYPVSAAVAVNAATLQVVCERLNLESRFGDATAEQSTACMVGSKLHVNGKCKKS